MTAFDLFAVGDNCIDKLSGHAEAVLVGGNAVNVAVQTARSGLSAAYAGALGPDGDRVADTLAANGVDIRWLVRRDAPTSVTEIYVGADGERTILKEDFGACSGWTPDAAARAAIAQARHVHIGWLDDGGALRRALKASGISVSQDLSVNVTSEENIRADGLSIAFASLPEARASEAAGRAAALVADGADTAAILPTFLGNHDMGRVGFFVKQANPEADDAEVMARVKLAHGLMMFMRGVPVIYSGDAQGVVSDGNDQSPRQDMFPSRTAVYNDNDLIGTDATTAESNFDKAHPLYRYIAETAAIRRAHPALSRGEMLPRLTEQDGSLFAFSRFAPVTGHEYLIVANTGNTARSTNINIDSASSDMATLSGGCGAMKTTGVVSLDIPAFGLTVCRSATPSSRFGK